MATTFEFVRVRLVEVSRSGVSVADLLKQIRTADVARRNGVYDSFRRYFHVLVKLGWVTRMSKSAPSFQRGVDESGILSDKGFYRLTQKGRDASDDDWKAPRKVLYPEYAESGAWRKWYIPTGKPRGRPKVKKVRRERRIAEVVTPEVAQREIVVRERPRERRRVIRLTPSQSINNKLQELLPRIDAVAESRDAVEIDSLEQELEQLFDRTLNAIESATGDEAKSLERTAQRLERASDGFTDMRSGIRVSNEVTFRRGFELVRTCCTGDEE